MDDDRMVKLALQFIYENRQIGDILIDVPATANWEDLQKLTG